MKKRSPFLVGFFVLALIACGTNTTGYTIQDFCNWQTFTSYEICIQDAEECASISNQNEPSIQCMANKGYPIPEEADLPPNGN